MVDNFQYERKHSSIEKYYILEGVYAKPYDNIPVPQRYFDMDEVEDDMTLQSIISYLIYFVNNGVDRDNDTLHECIRNYLLNTYNIIIRFRDIKTIGQYNLVYFDENNTQYIVTPKYKFSIYKDYLMEKFEIYDK